MSVQSVYSVKALPGPWGEWDPSPGSGTGNYSESMEAGSFTVTYKAVVIQAPTPSLPHLHWLSSCFATLPQHWPGLCSCNFASQPLLTAFVPNTLTAWHSQIQTCRAPSSLHSGLCSDFSSSESLPHCLIWEHFCHSLLQFSLYTFCCFLHRCVFSASYCIWYMIGA